jgi:hypothetical protein
MIKRGMELLLKSGVFILILISNNSFLSVLQVWIIETIFLITFFLYGKIQKKLIEGRYYRYNLMIFSFLMAAGLMYFSDEILQQYGERFNRLLVVMFFNYYMFLKMENGFKDVKDVSLTFIIIALSMKLLRTVFLYFPEPILLFSLPPGIIFSFGMVIAILKKILNKGELDV